MIWLSLFQTCIALPLLELLFSSLKTTKKYIYRGKKITTISLFKIIFSPIISTCEITS